MAEKAVADSSFLVALFDEADIFHKKAATLAKSSVYEAVFFDCVMNEVYSVLSKRAEEKKRKKDLPKIFEIIRKKIPPILMVWTYRDVRERYEEILKMMSEFEGKLNFHNCQIALAAQDLGIGDILSFDADFDSVGWLKRVE